MVESSMSGKTAATHYANTSFTVVRGEEDEEEEEKGGMNAGGSGGKCGGERNRNED